VRSRRLAKRRLEEGGIRALVLPIDALLLRSLRIGCMRCCKATVAAAALIGSHAGVYFAGERTVSLPLLLVMPCFY
jgi:hypothetical protein